jgi:hypothetical protein
VATTDLAIRLRAFTAEFQAGMVAAGGAVKTFAVEAKTELGAVGVAGEKLQKTFSGLMSALVGGAIIGGLYEMAKHASDVDAKFAVMAQTAKAMNETFNATEARKWVEGLATSVQGGGESIDTLTQGYTRFNVVLKDQAASQQAVQTALAVSAATGLGFDSVMSAMVKAAQGTNTGLSRLGVGLSAAKLKTMDFRQEIDYLNNFSLGALEKKGTSIAVQQAIIAQKFQITADTIGERLIPIFDKVLTDVGGMIDAWDKLSPSMQTLIENTVGTIAILSALGLILTPLFNMFGALGGVIGAVWKILSSTNAINTAIAGFRAVKVAAADAGAAVTAEADASVVAAAKTAEVGTAAKGAAAGTAALSVTLGTIVIACIGLVVWIKNVIDHYQWFYEEDKRLGGAFQDTWNGIVQVIKTDGKVILDVLLAIGDAFLGNWGGAKDAAAAAMDEIHSGMARAAVDFGQAGHAFGAALSVGFAAAEANINAGVAYVKGLFAGGAAPGGKGKDGKLPPPVYPDPVTKPGGAKAAAQGAKDMVQAAIDTTTSMLDGFTRRTEQATASFDKAKADLDTFKAKEIGGKPTTKYQEVTETALANAALAKELAVRAAIEAQIKAEGIAAQAAIAIQKSLSPHLTNHLALMRQLSAEVRKHVDAAQHLVVTYAAMGAPIAQLTAALKAPAAEYNQFLIDQQKFVDKLADIKAKAGFATSQEDLRFRESQARAAGKETPAMAAGFAVENAQLKVAMAKYADDIAIAADNVIQQSGTLAERATSTETVAAADAALAIAKHDETLATQAQTLAVAAAAFTLSNVFQAASKKIVDTLIPGLTMANDSFKLTLDWKTALLDAITHTRAYADIQRVAAAIMQVVAKMLDALRPVIDVMLKVLIGVVNVFIDVWNIFARIARLFGIQIPILQNLNDNLASLNVQPLIDITHDIPTLNELASGKIGPLIPKGGAGDYNSPTVNAINTGSNGIIGILEKILAAIIVISLIQKAAGFISSLFGGGGGGGILSGIMGMFGGGGGAFAGGAFTPLGGLGGAASGAGLAGAGGGGLLGAMGGLGSGTMLTTALSTLGWGVAAYGVYSLVKGLFGDHFQKKDEPDKYLKGYQAFLQQFNTTAGSGIRKESAFLASDASKSLTGQAAKDAAQLRQLGGKSGNLGIASEKNDVFTLGSGRQINVEQYMALVKRFAQEMGGAANGVANALLAGATAVRVGLGSAGNELAGAVRQSASDLTRAASPVATALTSAVSVVTNHYGDIKGIGDVRKIAGEIADSTVRAGKTNAYEMSRRAL